ncbi:MAG: methyltransferase domain-containing protein [Candidatus Eisenbacteria bacterium]|nr:methyltransferase domain-containing protein [Candidatus Eisenbacteria bacterium]
MGLTVIERWIREHLNPEESTSAALLYERMESQSGGSLPVIYRPLDPMRPGDWHDEALCGAFAYAMDGADRVLDLGPGDGWPSLRIAHAVGEIVGIDPSPRRVGVQRENARRLGVRNARFMEMNALDLAFEDAGFDGVVAASVLEQTGDPDRALHEVFRVLRPGGVFMMVFEDYAACFASDDGDEALWFEPDDEPVLFYVVREKEPPSERWYAFFVNGPGEKLATLTPTPERMRGLERGASGPPPPPWAGVDFFEELRRSITRTATYCLEHLSSETLTDRLERVGFADAVFFDHRMEPVRRFVCGAQESGTLPRLAPMFESICRTLGQAAVDGAGSPPGDVVITRRPGGASG